MTPAERSLREEYLVRLRKVAHRNTHNWRGADLDAGWCMACPSITALHRAVSVLERRPSDALGARLALHAAICASDFCQGNDHANRTQARFVAALRKAIRAETYDPVLGTP